MSYEPEQFRIDIPEVTLADLAERLRRTRWPTDPENEDWRYGTSRAYLEPFVQYWLTEYDWRAQEAAMNRFDHFRVVIDGVPVHYLLRRGTGPNPVPLLLTHGWPWTFWDLNQVIEPLADPGAHGGDPADAFDVVVPSLPGFAFSSPLRQTGVGVARTAELWRTLMRDVLGYQRFGAQGSDFGAVVTQRLAEDHPEDIVGVHLSRYKRPAGSATPGASAVRPEDYGPDEAGDFERNAAGLALAASHLAVHTNDPQSLAYGLTDSPAALAAWILERRRSWSDNDGDIEQAFTRDHLITTLMLYWVTDTVGSSLRFYWETAREGARPPHGGEQVVTVPVAVGVMPKDVQAMPRRHAEEDTDLRRWTRFPRGGHFGAAEVPDLMVEDLRAFFRPLRGEVG
ncbi:epoxide hydrolase family protein [Jatrophihabitans sp.]|uniref:epoxide hydrolase family protein n=1 Tax=Jatrophihabitans sp. TaxID=1932789 RepID=UPI0030C65DF9|nr:alpha/beta fold hydrolase [Jatrophihabitans sp.]